MPKSKIESVRSALEHIPPGDRELWIRIGLALQSEFPGDDGFALFDEWSQRSESYSEHAVRDSWKSFKPGRVTLGTLWHKAKEHGYKGSPPAPEAAAEAQRKKAHLAQQRAAEEAQYRARADQAARDAVALWSEASDEGASPYLDRKAVRGHGVRFTADSTLLVPMCNARGELVNVQRIAPTKPTAEETKRGKREKRFLLGGRKSGCWHQIGQASGADVVVLGEGYATGATIFEAHRAPGGGGLGRRQPGQRWRRHSLSCTRRPACCCAGDDDRETEARTGTNTGRVKATRGGAQLWAGWPCSPMALPPAPERLQRPGPARAGLDAVRGTDRSGGRRAAGRRHASTRQAHQAGGRGNCSQAR
jgi:putative DNA primase/helicase